MLSIVQDESCTALDLAAEIDGDRVLAGQVLRLVNSPAYGLQRGVTSIPDAAIILGFDEVERIALTVFLVGLFGRDREDVKAQGSLWRHSVASAIAGQAIEQRNRRSALDFQGAHLAAFLHDIGKAVIAYYLPEARAQVARVVSKGAPVLDAEREALDGATHADVGAWIADGWGLPPAVVEGIARHHSADECSEDEAIVHAAHAANCMAKRVGLGAPQSQDAEELNPASCDVVGLNGELANYIAHALNRSRCLMGAVSRGDMFGPAMGA